MDALPDTPVQQHEAGVHRLSGADPPGVDQGAQFGEQLRRIGSCGDGQRLTQFLVLFAHALLYHRPDCECKQHRLTQGEGIGVGQCGPAGRVGNGCHGQVSPGGS